MEIDQERLNAFQTRMSTWVASQGLFFQLRYAAAVQGVNTSVLGILSRVLLRFGVLLVVVACGVWLFLAKRIDTEWFQESLGESIASGLNAESAVVGTIKRERGQVNIRQLTVEGGEESFFYAAEIRDLRTRMNLLDGIVGPWNGGTLTMRSLELSLKSGADTDEIAAKSFNALFKEAAKFRFDSIEAQEVTLTWGYSEQHRGSIRGARLKVTRREEGGWLLVFEGGLLSQNWLRRFEIERIEAVLAPDTLEFPVVKLKKEGGALEFGGRFTSLGARPELAGSGRLSSLPIWSLVDGEFRDYLDGTISGALTLGGSTNSQAGLSAEVEVALEEGDEMILRDRFAILRAISAVDRFRSYKKVRFTTGGFHMKTGNSRLEISRIALQSQESMRLEGALAVRPPTEEEVKATLEMKKISNQTPTVENGKDAAPDKAVGILQAAVEKQRKKESADRLKAIAERLNDGTVPSLIVGSQLGSADLADLNANAWVREEQTFHIEGSVRIGISAEVFERAPELAATFPVDEASGLRWLTLPLNGQIFTVGAPLAEQIYLQSRGGP